MSAEMNTSSEMGTPHQAMGGSAEMMMAACSLPERLGSSAGTFRE